MKAAWLSGTTIISADNGCEPPSAKVVIPKAAHAVHVRPVGNRYQLLAGHHRIRAARAKGLSNVWAWVEPMDDEDAFMELIVANSQSEVAPLEVGRHAREWKCRSGRGSKGKGLRGYLARIGPRCSERHLGELVQAATVYDHVTPELNAEVDLSILKERAAHLTAIHSTDRRVWPECVETMLKSGWTARGRRKPLGNQFPKLILGPTPDAPIPSWPRPKESPGVRKRLLPNKFGKREGPPPKSSHTALLRLSTSVNLAAIVGTYGQTQRAGCLHPCDVT